VLFGSLVAFALAFALFYIEKKLKVKIV
jgi:hypothetical protein